MIVWIRALECSKILQSPGFLLRRHVPWLRLDLLEGACAASASLALWVNALRLATNLYNAPLTAPNVFVLDLIGMTRGDFDLATAVQWVILHCLDTFPSPCVEICTVRLVLHIRDHEVEHMAKFVGQGVQKTVFVGDDALSELNAAFVSDDTDIGPFAGLASHHFAFALVESSAGGLLEGPGPDDWYAAGALSAVQNLSTRHSEVQCLDDGLGESRLVVVKLGPALLLGSLLCCLFFLHCGLARCLWCRGCFGDHLRPEFRLGGIVTPGFGLCVVEFSQKFRHRCSESLQLSWRVVVDQLVG